MLDRRLAAIMATDIVGFTALMGSDQHQALDIIARSHDALKTIVERFGGEWLEDPGDRSLTAFPSAISAVECAVAVQSEFAGEPELKFRVGVDVGDIVVTDGHVYGDAVNIASMIERFADPGGIILTEAVYESVQAHIDLNVIDMGDKSLKNVNHAVRLYAISGTKQRSRISNFFAGLYVRRVPHITGAYLAASWAVVEVIEWSASNGLLDPRWTYAVFVGLLSLVPSVILVAYLHGAHGPDQIKREEKFGVPLNLLLAAVLIASVYRSAEIPMRTDPVDPASVAVLPFVNMSDDPGNEYFSQGLSEELINALAKVPGLYVASRTSSFIFNGQTEDPRSIARKLRVATILEGSVRKQDNRVRVTAQLIDGQNNYHLWTETYESRLDDAFEIQESIAIAVTRQLVGVLQPNVATVLASARAATADAYDFYLRGLSYLRAPPTEASLQTAHNLFQRALAQDRNYAQAHAGMCEVALAQYELVNAPALIDAAESDCLRAFRLNANMREVRQALGVLYRYQGDYEESATIFRNLLDDQPTADAWVGLGETNAAGGNFEAAEVAFRTAIEREPGNWRNRMALAEFLYWRSRFKEALDALQRVIELSPDNARAYLLIGATQDYLGNDDASLKATLRSIELSPTRGAHRDLGLTYYYAQDFGQAAEAFEKAVELGPEDHWSLGSLAHAYYFLGDAERAKSAYETAIDKAMAVLERNPRDWVTNARLALYYVMNGATDEGLRRIRISVAEGAQMDEVHFYAAGIHAHLGQNQQALDALETAIELGFPVRLIAKDPQFTTLRSEERFINMLENN